MSYAIMPVRIEGKESLENFPGPPWAARPDRARDRRRRSFSRTGDSALGDFDGAVILKAVGKVDVGLLSA
jgi:hypothetical protein